MFPKWRRLNDTNGAAVFSAPKGQRVAAFVKSRVDGRRRKVATIELRFCLNLNCLCTVTASPQRTHRPGHHTHRRIPTTHTRPWTLHTPPRNVLKSHKTAQKHHTHAPDMSHTPRTLDPETSPPHRTQVHPRAI